MGLSNKNLPCSKTKSQHKWSSISLGKKRFYCCSNCLTTFITHWPDKRPNINRAMRRKLHVTA